MAEFTDSMIDVRSISDYSRPQSFPCDQAPIWSPFRPLRSAILCTPAVQFIDADVRTQLLYADECLYHQRHSEAIPYLESGLFAIGCRRLPELRGLLWVLLATAHAATGNLQEACVCYHNHLTCCIIMDDIEGITKTECNLGIAYAELGHLKLAGAWFTQYLENSYRLEDQMSVSVALNNLAVLSETLGVQAYHKKKKKYHNMSAARKTLNRHLRRAVTYLEQHLMFEQQQLNNIVRQCQAYGNLGWCYQAMRQYPKALFYHNKCLEILRMTGDKIAESFTLCNLGNCLKATGSFQDAIEHYTQNLELSRAIGYREGEIVSILNLGTTCRLVEQLDRAIEWHTLYYSAMVENDDLGGQAKALSTLASLYEDTHKMTKAEDCYRKLAAVNGQLNKREAERMACLQAQKMRSGAKQEKQLSIKQSKKTLKIYKSSPRRGKYRTVSCSTLYLIPEPKRRQRVDREVNVQDCQHSVGQSKSESVRPFIQNQFVDKNIISSQPLQQQQVTGRVEFQEQISFHQEQRESFYKQDHIIPDQRPLPQSPPQSETDSLTSFETITPEENQSFLQHISRASLEMVDRVMPELMYIGADYSQTVSQQEFGDKEWEQWLHIQDTTCSNPCSQALSETFNIDTSALYRSRDRSNPRRMSSLSFRPHYTASDPNILGHQVQ